jgi:hypothetical protein
VCVVAGVIPAVLVCKSRPSIAVVLHADQATT